MDVKMPVMDGLEATRRLKAMPEGATTPVIAISASVLEGDRSEVLDAGADGFIGKPFREGEIFGVLERVIGMRFEYEADDAGPAREAAKGAGAAAALARRT